MKVLRMAYSIVENVPTPRESIFKLFPASQHPYRAKNQKWTENPTHLFINISPISPRVGGMGYALEVPGLVLTPALGSITIKSSAHCGAQ